METTAGPGDLLMLAGTVALCPDCGDEQIMVPVDDHATGAVAELCCTSCDAAVVVLDLVASDRHGFRRAS